MLGLDVTPTQFSFMTCLVFLSQEGSVTPSHIVRHTGMDKMMVSDLVKTLAKKKLLGKKNNPADKRSWLIFPTSKGIETTNSAVRLIEAFDAEFFKKAKGMPELHANLLALATPDELEDTFEQQPS